MRYEDFHTRFERKTKTPRGFMVKCPAHEDGKSSLSIGRAKDGGVLLKCFAGCEAASIVQAMGLEMKDLFAGEEKRDFKPYKAPKPTAKEPEPPKATGPAEIDTIYSYTDALGNELYQALRMKPKSFRQRHKVNGQWLWNMDGVERVLYRLESVLRADCVWIVEGEKDADNLAALGLTATCNVGGANKWLDGYTASLKGKDVVICGDNDAPGQEHVKLVFDSVAEAARSVRVIKLPGEVKDASDFILEHGEGAKKALEALLADAVKHVGGIRMPLYSMADLEPHYHQHVTQPEISRLDLSRWLPSFRGRVRPITPGSLVLIQGDTGIGKTNILQQIYAVFKSVPTIFFEMELPKEDMFERFCAQHLNAPAHEIEAEFKAHGPVGAKAMGEMFPNLFICPEPSLTIERLEQILSKSELFLGAKPVVALIDYTQLMVGNGSSRYERASDVAEGLRRVAKKFNIAVFVASQIDRASAKDANNGLHSAKDTGSLENSANLVLAADRDPEDPTLLTIRVLKATKGGAGLVIPCNIDGARSRITERTKQQEP